MQLITGIQYYQPIYVLYEYVCTYIGYIYSHIAAPMLVLHTWTRQLVCEYGLATEPQQWRGIADFSRTPV